MASHGGEKGPASYGRGAHFSDYEHQVHPWMRTARAEMPARSSSLISRKQPAPRQICLAEGSDILEHSTGVSKISDILRNDFAREAVAAIHQQVTRFMRVRRTDQSIDGYTAASDLLSEGRVQNGQGGLASRSKSRGNCVWTTRPYLATKSPWSWRAATKVCGLRTRRPICGDCFVRVEAEVDN